MPEARETDRIRWLRSRIGESPGKASVVFSGASELTTGVRCRATVRNHELTMDEPEALGGTDEGPCPAEVVLAALASCQAITYRMYAECLGVAFESIAVTVDGHLNLAGFLALDETARSGFKKIDVRVEVESSAPEEALESLRNAVEAHCPVLDSIRHPTDVEMTMTVRRS